METGTIIMLIFYFIVVGGGSFWTMKRSLKGGASYTNKDDKT